MATRTAKEKTGKSRLTRDDWVLAARTALIKGGIDQVKVNRLAKTLRITRGSFYWFFKHQQDLLDALLADWTAFNTQSFLKALDQPGHDGRVKIQALMKLWLDEEEFDPRYDSAVRDWARTSAKVAKSVRAADDRRIAGLKQVFLDFGYPDDEAFIRARVTYYHQVGYYAMDVKETRADRLKLHPLYYKALTGYPA